MKVPKLRRKSVMLIILALLSITMFAFLELTGRTTVLLDRGSKRVVDNTSKTTSDAPSAQSDYSSGGKREVQEREPKSTTEVKDTRGTTESTYSSKPLTSADGAITVLTPGLNSTFRSGSSLAGKSSLEKVSYRLMDNVSGVTATGSLDVVNGSFSGTFSFSSSATAGRLDVFQVGPGGIEKSIIEIPVNLR